MMTVWPEDEVVYPPQPTAAWTVKVAAVEVAGLPAIDPSVSEVSAFPPKVPRLTAESGVPPVAADVAETVTALPGVQVPAVEL
jgi:hypothetical protein